MDGPLMVANDASGANGTDLGETVGDAGSPAPHIPQK